MLHRNKRSFFLFAGACFFAWGRDAAAQSVTVDFTKTKQVVDGFGAATVWHGALSDALMDIAFKNENNTQMGMTILRESVEPGGQNSWSGAKSNIQKAKARGALTFSTPWTPPSAMKDGSNKLKTASYSDYVAYLKQYCDFVGPNLDILSVQNEPNITGSPSIQCVWDGQLMLDWCKNFAHLIGKPIMMPEAYNFDIKLSEPTLDDATAASHVSYVGGHLYGGKPFEYTKAINMGKKIWMTEIYFNPEDANTCMQMAKQILDCMYYSMNGYVWWYYRTTQCNLINNSGVINHKGYVMAQFSKFVRPGFRRVEATYNPKTGVYAVAFKGAQNVVVAINTGTSAASQTFEYAGATVTSVRKITSSSSKNLVEDNTVTVSNNSFTTSLDAQSVNTFVSAGVPDALLPFGGKAGRRGAAKAAFVDGAGGRGDGTDAFLYMLNGRKLTNGQEAGWSPSPGLYIRPVSAAGNDANGL